MLIAGDSDGRKRRHAEFHRIEGPDISPSAAFVERRAS
jgi:hypothetical protein